MFLAGNRLKNLQFVEFTSVAVAADVVVLSYQEVPHTLL